MVNKKIAMLIMVTVFLMTVVIMVIVMFGGDKSDGDEGSSQDSFHIFQQKL